MYCLLYCCCSITKSCLTLCNPMNWSMPGFPALQYLPELAQTHVHWVSDTILPSHPLSPLLCLPSESFPASGSFLLSQLFAIKWPKYWSFSFSTSPSNECSELISFRIDSLLSNALSRIFSNTTVQKHQFFGAQRLKCLLTMPKTLVQSLGREDPLEKEMATHSSILT